MTKKQIRNRFILISLFYWVGIAMFAAIPSSGGGALGIFGVACVLYGFILWLYYAILEEYGR